MKGLNSPLNRKLRMALIGGAGNAFIGKVHATAGTLDNRADLVAGALSSNASKSQAAAPSFGIPSDRAYASPAELIENESQRPADERIDFVSIATPNYTHFEIAKAALTAGFHVVCDKPMTITVDEAEDLARVVEATGAVFVLMHNYSGYPMIRQLREMIRNDELGDIIAVRANYIQGWLWGLSPGVDPPRGAWKADPQKAGPSGTLGDIGTHAYQLVRYTTGLLPEEVSCNLKTYTPDRALDDYGHATIRFQTGALGLLTFSQVTHGRMNDQLLEIDGSKAAISWRQEDPNQLVVRQFGRPTQVYDRHPGADFNNPSARAASRLPGGHPEAFFEAFANLFRDGFDDMVTSSLGKPFQQRDTIYPNVYDGVEGTFFIQQCLASHDQNGTWISLRHPSAR